jgi:mannose-6-phosphate isomerase-like protein (cupin superfamily)
MMHSQKTFEVFGEKVEIFVTGEMSSGTMVVGVQTSPPGGGPGPHIHAFEDEFFTVIEGEFEMFDGKKWHSLKSGESYFSRRGETHSFRNSGITVGRMQVVVSPAGLDKYLEELGKLSAPENAEEIQELSAKYGLRLIP